MSPVPLTQLEVPDYDLGLRGKLVRSEKLTRSGKAAFCTIIYGLDPADGVADTPLSSAANGYPDAFAVPDESTRVQLPWRRATEAVIADMVDDDGALLEESPRTVLARVVAGFAELGLVPVLGFEYECYVLHADDDVLRRGDYASLRALGRVDNAYSIGRHTESADLLGEFIDRMDSIGIPVEAAHSELGPGFFEFAMSPMDAMRAADSAVRARQYFRDLCAERGLVATFMAKLRIEASGSGGHVHQSVTRDGVNQFSDGANGLSDTGRAYLGGLVRSMGDYTVLLNPLLNSYKRISAGFFVAERATWGWDNRNAACRVVHNAGSAATRVEHRRPGADANPYLVAAALLAGGLEGLRDGLDPGDPLEVGSDIATAGDALPSTLPTAIAAFRGSSRARSMLGDRFVDCYAATRDAEVAAFETWWNTSITDWELRRYVEHL
ncbi:glutamine synthetase family protein [Longivirga aurantiaca]|uniref:Glutamine synthetase family protein n=1 Tax=Longivirga aurantiaca TaxID=1837743 RepID=A0ABW1SVH1_9ACTN